MADTVATATSPLNCHWIEPGSRRSIDRFEYAICQRVHDAQRVVNEAECAVCPSWEPPRSTRSGQPAQHGLPSIPSSCSSSSSWRVVL